MVLLVVCVCPIVQMNSYADSSVTQQYGDVNNDGNVDIFDLVLIRQYLLGMVNNINFEMSDLNCDYMINLVDFEILQAYLLGEIPQLPVKDIGHLY